MEAADWLEMSALGTNKSVHAHKLKCKNIFQPPTEPSSGGLCLLTHLAHSCPSVSFTFSVCLSSLFHCFYPFLTQQHPCTLNPQKLCSLVLFGLN